MIDHVILYDILAKFDFILLKHVYLHKYYISKVGRTNHVSSFVYFSVGLEP